jgi:hypothetical protein
MKAIVERLTGAVAAVERRSAGAALETSSATVAVEPGAGAVGPSGAAVEPSGATVAVGPRRTFALPERPPPGAAAEGAPAESQGPARGGEIADALAAAVERLRARAEAARFEPRPARERPPAQPPHKHSMSLIGRWRVRRKQRRSR